MTPLQAFILGWFLGSVVALFVYRELLAFFETLNRLKEEAK